MKVFDAYVFFRGLCPIGVDLEKFIHDIAREPAPPGQEGVRNKAQALCDAEELFLPADVRMRSQLLNPRYKLVLTDLPAGVTAIFTDGNSNWCTSASDPDRDTAVYYKELPCLTSL